MLFRYLYSLIYCMLLPFIVLRLLWRSMKAPAYRQRIAERFALFKAPNFSEKSIWLHAVSVGETLAAAPLIRALQAHYPQHVLVVTTTTPTGSERVKALFGETVFHVYSPYDLPWIVSSFLKKIKPAVAIVMETELWPNMIASCAANGVPTVIANARLSEKSAMGYERFAPLTNHMLKQITAIAAQNATDGGRFVGLGLPEERLHNCGSIKFDLEIDSETQQHAQSLRQHWDSEQSRVIWLAASTHPGEDEIILETLRRLNLKLDNILLVLVPRHPERFDSVYDLCKRNKFNIARHSKKEKVESFTNIVLGDTMGELLAFYGACDLAFVGGSLVPVGGHNMIEPAAWGKPIISGPHLHNFNEISQLLIAADGMQICTSEDELYHTVKEWSQNETKRKEVGSTAEQFALQNKGALQRIMKVIDNIKK